MPTNTDLVSQLPADFEVFGQAVDTSLADLKGGTTNQVLAKNSNTDMDFKWVADAAGMTNPMTTTGDTIYSSSGSTPARLGIGTAGQILQVNSGATAPEWATPAGGANFTLLNTGGTSLSGTTTTISGISAKNKIYIVLQNVGQNVGSSTIRLRLNTDTGSNYDGFAGFIRGGSTYSSGLIGRQSAFNGTSFALAILSDNASSDLVGYVMIDGCNAAGLKPVMFATGVNRGGGNDHDNYTGGGVYKGTSAISSISIVSNNNLSGTAYVYTSA